jgi:dolichyl-phosphate beta-glucosyltransferase
MADEIDLSVVVPAYNEARNFKEGKLIQVYDYLSRSGLRFELLLANDGSSDNTYEQMCDFAKDRKGVRAVDLPHRGKGPTVADTMLMAKGASRLFTDFDQSTPIQEVEKLLSWQQKGYDVVIGSREISGALREAEPWYRHVMGKGFNLVVQVMAVRGIQDTQCGFKLLSAEATKTLFPLLQVTNQPRADAFTGAMDVELLFLARKKGFKIKEIPVHWKHVESQRVAPIKDSVRMFVDVARIRWAYLGGVYA